MKLVLALLLFATPGLSSDTSECKESFKNGYEAGKDDWYWKGHSKGYNSAMGEYQDKLKAAYKNGYDDGYDDGDRIGYLKGREDGYEEGYQNGRDDFYLIGTCTYIFKWNGDIVNTENECTKSEQCQDNNRNTFNLCILK